jgi:hypothetical protein
MLGLANMSGTWDLGPGTPCEPALGFGSSQKLYMGLYV